MRVGLDEHVRGRDLENNFSRLAHAAQSAALSLLNVWIINGSSLRKGDVMTTETQKQAYLARKPVIALPLPQRIAQFAAIAAAFGFVIVMLASGHIS